MCHVKWRLTISCCYVSCRGHLPRDCRLVCNSNNEVLPWVPVMEPYQLLLVRIIYVYIGYIPKECIFMCNVNNEVLHHFQSWSVTISYYVSCWGHLPSDLRLVCKDNNEVFHNFKSWSLTISRFLSGKRHFTNNVILPIFSELEPYHELLLCVMQRSHSVRV